MTTQKPVNGIMAVRYVPVPYDDPERQRKADEDSKALSEKFGQSIRLGRSVYDWGYHLSGKKQRDAVPFQTGDLVRVFKTVTDGDVKWQGTVDYDRTKYHHGFQKGMSPAKWTGMFYDCLPAKLVTKDGRTIYGALSAHAETGTEGEVWSVCEYGKEGYDGLNCLREGDSLTVYSTVRNGDIEWQGIFDAGPEQISTINKNEKELWKHHEVWRETNHMPTNQWLQFSWQNRPVIIVPRQP